LADMAWSRPPLVDIFLDLLDDVAHDITRG
jgi:hypothetical protein